MPRLYLLFVIPLTAILCLASESPADSGTWDRVLAQVPSQWRDGVARNLDLASEMFALTCYGRLTSNE